MNNEILPVVPVAEDKEILMNNEILPVVPVAEDVLTFCGIKANTAANLTREETQILMNWCDHQREVLWEGMSLQEILNVYRVSAVWDDFESWEEEEPYAALEGWNSVVHPRNRLISYYNGE